MNGPRGPKEASPEIKAMVDTQPDFVAVRTHGHSLRALMAKYVDRVPPHVEAKALGRNEGQVRALFASTMKQLRRLIGVKKGE